MVFIRDIKLSFIKTTKTKLMIREKFLLWVVFKAAPMFFGIFGFRYALNNSFEKISEAEKKLMNEGVNPRSNTMFF